MNHSVLFSNTREDDNAGDSDGDDDHDDDDDDGDTLQLNLTFRASSTAKVMQARAKPLL